MASLVIVLGLMAPVPGSERTVTGLVPIFGLDPALGEGARAAGYGVKIVDLPYLRTSGPQKSAMLLG